MYKRWYSRGPDHKSIWNQTSTIAWNIGYNPPKTNGCPLRHDGWLEIKFPFKMVPFLGDVSIVRGGGEGGKILLWITCDRNFLGSLATSSKWRLLVWPMVFTLPLVWDSGKQTKKKRFRNLEPILLMEEILHHLGSTKPVVDNEPFPQLVNAGFPNHQQ